MNGVVVPRLTSAVGQFHNYMDMQMCMQLAMLGWAADEISWMSSVHKTKVLRKATAGSVEERRRHQVPVSATSSARINTVSLPARGHLWRRGYQDILVVGILSPDYFGVSLLGPPPAPLNNYNHLAPMVNVAAYVNHGSAVPMLTSSRYPCKIEMQSKQAPACASFTGICL